MLSQVDWIRLQRLSKKVVAMTMALLNFCVRFIIICLESLLFLMKKMPRTFGLLILAVAITSVISHTPGIGWILVIAASIVMIIAAKISNFIKSTKY